jgi:uncharacterized membrane protein
MPWQGRSTDRSPHDRQSPSGRRKLGQSSATHYKGFDQFGSVTFHLGAEPLVAALKGSEFELTYMPAHEAVEKFPFDDGGA